MDSLLFEMSLNSTQIRRESRWEKYRSRRGRRWIRTHSSSASTLSSLSPSPKTLDLGSLCFSFLHNRLSVSSLSGSPMSASSLCTLGCWSALTLDSAGRDVGSFPAASRELDGSFDDLAIQPLISSHVSCSLHVPGSLLSLSLSRATLEAPSGSFSSSCWILSRVCMVPNSCSNGTATHTLGGETKPLKHLPADSHSPVDDWWVNTWRMRTPVASNLREIHTEVDISAMPVVCRPQGSLDAQHELCGPSVLSTELSHRPASDHS